MDRHDTALLRRGSRNTRNAVHAEPIAAERRRLGAPPAAQQHAHARRPGTAGSTQARAAAASFRPAGDAPDGRLRGRVPHVRLLRRDRAGAACAPHVHCMRTACALHAHCMHTACTPQALPAALMRSGSSAKAATTLGTLGSVSALVEVMLSNSFGKLTDAIGRKPVLILAPALAVAARATVVVWPSLPVLLGARFCTTLVVPPSRLACAPHVHCVCTACAPRVHRMRTACAAHAHRIYRCRCSGSPSPRPSPTSTGAAPPPSRLSTPASQPAWGWAMRWRPCLGAS